MVSTMIVMKVKTHKHHCPHKTQIIMRVKVMTMKRMTMRIVKAVVMVIALMNNMRKVKSNYLHQGRGKIQVMEQ